MEKVFLPELSKEYGAKIFSFGNPRFPFHIEGITLSEYGDEEGCTEEEIKGLVDYHTHDGIRPWASHIIGWYESIKSCPTQQDEITDLLDELDWYLDTIYGVKTAGEYPDWLQEYLNEEEEYCDGAEFHVWTNIIDKVIPHIN